MKAAQFVFCRFRDRIGVQCEREKDHRGRHEYDLATGGVRRWKGGLVPARGATPGTRGAK